MFNPLKTFKIGSVEKRLLIGALADSVVYYGNLFAMNNPAYPAELKNRLEPHLPRNGEILGSVVSPATFYIVKKALKNPSEKAKVGDMFLGASLHALPNLVHDVAIQSAWQAGVDSKPAARLPAPLTLSKYIAPMQNSRPAIPSGLSKYAITG